VGFVGGEAGGGGGGRGGGGGGGGGVGLPGGRRRHTRPPPRDRGVRAGPGRTLPAGGPSRSTPRGGRPLRSPRKGSGHDQAIRNFCAFWYDFISRRRRQVAVGVGQWPCCQTFLSSSRTNVRFAGGVESRRWRVVHYSAVQHLPATTPSRPVNERSGCPRIFLSDVGPPGGGVDPRSGLLSQSLSGAEAVRALGGPAPKWKIALGPPLAYQFFSLVSKLDLVSSSSPTR